MGTVFKGISDICGINYDIASGGFRCVFCPGGVTVEGVKSIASFNNESLVLKLKNGKMEIKGGGLRIRELTGGFISVSGAILSVSLV